MPKEKTTFQDRRLSEIDAKGEHSYNGVQKEQTIVQDVLSVK